MASFRIRISCTATAVVAVAKRWEAYVVGNNISVHRCGGVSMRDIAVAMLPNLTMDIMSLH